MSITLYVLNSREDLGAASRPALTRQELPVKIRLSSSRSMVEQMLEDEFERYPVPRAFALDGTYVTLEPNRRRIKSDIHGALTYCYPSAFARIVLPEDEDPFNRAAIAYVLALPSDWPIVLYWS